MSWTHNILSVLLLPHLIGTGTGVALLQVELVSDRTTTAEPIVESAGGHRMWYDAQRTGMETVKAVLSVAVLWGGMFVSGAADQAMLEPFGVGATDDIVGVWKWVAGSSLRRPDATRTVASLLEIRRADDGSLSARVLVNDGPRPVVKHVDGVSFEEGRLCLEIDGQAAFKGTLREDGRSIDGTVLFDGRKSSSAELRKVEARTGSRGVAPLRAT